MQRTKDHQSESKVPSKDIPYIPHIFDIFHRVMEFEYGLSILGRLYWDNVTTSISSKDIAYKNLSSSQKSVFCLFV